MDRRLLRYYNQELQHLRSTAGDFAREFPKIASRLALDDFACGDPYVERLLEGFAFLAARVQLKLDAEFPQFTQSILETVYPNYLSPTPSMAVVGFTPELAAVDMENGYVIDRGTVLRSVIGKDELTACEYRTGHSVTIWPLKLTKGEYIARDLSSLAPPSTVLAAKAAIRIRLETPPEIPFSGLNLDALTFFIRGAEDFPMQVYEQIFAHGTNVLIQTPEKPFAWQHVLPRDAIRQVGFIDEEALLPAGARTFIGYRLLHEYFAFPNRFLFFRIEGLRHSVKRCRGNRLDLVIMLGSEDTQLGGAAR